MRRIDSLCLCVSLCSAVLLVYSYEASIAYDYPVHIFVITAIVFPVALLVIANRLPGFLTNTSGTSPVSSSLPAVDNGAKTPAQLPSPSPSPSEANLGVVTLLQKDEGQIDRQTWLLGAAIMLILPGSIFRVGFHQQISMVTECSMESVEVWLPLLLFLYDCVRTQRARHVDLPSENTAGLAARLKGVITKYVARRRFRYLPSVAAICLGCHLLLSMSRPLNSTAICPVGSPERRTIPMLQLVNLMLDFYFALVLYELVPRGGISVTSWQQNGLLLAVWIPTVFFSALPWGLIGILFCVSLPYYRLWILLLDTSSFFATYLSVVFQSILLSVFVVSTLHTIVRFGLCNIVLVLTVLSTLLPAISVLWTFRDLFPPVSPISLTTAFLLIYLGWWSFCRVRHRVNPREPGPSWPRLTLLLVVVLLAPAWFKKSSLSSHPIDKLLSQAEKSHQEYLNSAKLDQELPLVASRYKDRYGRTPPPGFDVWWKYARDRSTLILDEYDQINEDLLPFWAIDPAEIRRQTWEILANPWNEVGGIFIRDGVARAQENVDIMHAWMIDGLVEMINKFAHNLPDMDLAFNLNDESRVAVPYEELQTLHRQAEATKSSHSTSASWSPDRASGWLPVPPIPRALNETSRYSKFSGTSVFQDLAFQNTFSRFGSVGCPPWSASRSRRRIASQSSLCYSCVAPHTIAGQFLSNWTLAGDVCHQPDLAYLHGFYLSPSAFKTTHSLRPVFSQSKPHPYNDILYPSVWNYLDKAVYAPFHPDFPDPPFKEKTRTLFWRGATSEGVSAGNAVWRKMARQRLVHLANNLTTHPHDDITLFLPRNADSDSDPTTIYGYATIPGPYAASELLSVNARFVDHIARCGTRLEPKEYDYDYYNNKSIPNNKSRLAGFYDDCYDQEIEFSPATVPPTPNFQSHWQYKYLFDLDGAGFSGRFLPFLQSRSVPFKAALFREWYDSRLTAWRHFVPVDVRLHGLWSTLAYFAGLDVDPDLLDQHPHHHHPHHHPPPPPPPPPPPHHHRRRRSTSPSTSTSTSIRPEDQLPPLPLEWQWRWKPHDKQAEMIAEEGREWSNQVLRKEDMEVYFFRLLLEWGRLTDDNRQNLGFTA